MVRNIRIALSAVRKKSPLKVADHGLRQFTAKITANLVAVNCCKSCDFKRPCFHYIDKDRSLRRCDSNSDARGSGACIAEEIRCMG